MALQVLFLSSFIFLLLSLGGQGSGPPAVESLLPCSESLQEQRGLGLDDPVSSLHWGAEVLETLQEPASCAEACCALADCNLALLQDSSCYLINCIFQGKNVCRLEPRDGAIAYQRGDMVEQPTTEDFCLAPMVVGPCRAAIERWHYDAENKSCTVFIFGGCNANLNNHVTEEVCVKMCSDLKSDEKSNEIVPASKRMAATSSIPDYCILKPEAGPCRGALRRWYYVMEEEICNTFIYGGCKGNENNHDSEKACMDKCSTFVSEPEKIKTDKVNFQEYCAAPSDTGPCRAAFPRWYYNISSRTCTEFIYGGCNGNRNNHQSEDICKERCVAHPDTEGGSDPLHTTTHHSTTAVALAVLLAVMAAILLGAMVVVFVKMTRRNHQESSLATIWSPIDDKECLMKNAYTL
uniref:Kunitz-type protease inhibitor 2 isoform X1 n=1 Tax=Geotrypetes seraphini TaxID=260995 RepID=A0A6P8S2N9_GEOSA|nr:kunitz-type protease inhibitor 2 isoform X1 [Geotrypetes seraphini]